MHRKAGPSNSRRARADTAAVEPRRPRSWWGHCGSRDSQRAAAALQRPVGHAARSPDRRLVLGVARCSAACATMSQVSAATRGRA